MLRVMGVDPGSRITGFAVVVWTRGLWAQPFVEAIGALKAKTSDSHTLRVGAMHKGLYELLEKHKPHVCVMEKVFLGPNVSSALKLGQVRGALMAAASRNLTPLEDLSPLEIKKGAGFSGKTDKKTLKQILQIRLGISLEGLPLDASDALAAAISFSAHPKAIDYFSQFSAQRPVLPS